MSQNLSSNWVRMQAWMQKRGISPESFSCLESLTREFNKSAAAKAGLQSEAGHPPVAAPAFDRPRG